MPRRRCETPALLHSRWTGAEAARRRRGEGLDRRPVGDVHRHGLARPRLRSISSATALGGRRARRRRRPRSCRCGRTRRTCRCPIPLPPPVMTAVLPRSHACSLLLRRPPGRDAPFPRHTHASSCRDDRSSAPDPGSHAAMIRLVTAATATDASRRCRHPRRRPERGRRRAVLHQAARRLRRRRGQGGAPGRRPGPPDGSVPGARPVRDDAGGLFLHLNTNKRGVVVDARIGRRARTWSATWSPAPTSSSSRAAPGDLAAAGLDARAASSPSTRRSSSPRSRRSARPAPTGTTR